MQKALFIIFALFSSVQMAARGNEQVIVINPDHGCHSGLPIWPADQPEVYYDDDEQEIIIDGPGSEASYYDVDIVSLSTFDTMLSTQVNGTYDTIDVSSLPDDNYKIVITSSNFNEYEGYFTNY